MTTVLLPAVRLLDPIRQTDSVADVLVQDGIVQAIAPAIDAPADTVIDKRSGLVMGPGLMDLYSTSGEPGYEARETLESLLKSAEAGGFTRLTLLPHMQPPMDNPAMVTWLRSRLQTCASAVRVELWGALTQGLQGDRMAELAELAEAGVVGFTDGQPIAQLNLLHRLLDYLTPYGKPLALWCCDRSLSYGGTAREGQDSIRLGLPGHPAMAETAAIAAVLECLTPESSPVHVMRISTARSVELIQQGKQRGLPITASTTWMHLLWTTADLEHYDPNLRLDPPLGTPADRAALVQAIATGVLDAIAVDHTPHTYEDKTVAFNEAPPGAIGLELALPLLWEAFVATGQWDALTLWSCLSTHPALFLQQEPPQIAVGQSAELTLFDPHADWTVTRQTLQSRSHNTPYLGRSLRGRVIPWTQLMDEL
ncbi:dihydroorotase [Leptolyngbya sp. CCY15150]|uniref:dihydroorotase n=1 Tax=Leptolyngbya sp. CCY15150 TaxID=2767772 RepID=UPI00194DFD63|nr:dihydroorotase [Leptolyngbya sp. CCY15150]